MGQNFTLDENSSKANSQKKVIRTRPVYLAQRAPELQTSESVPEKQNYEQTGA